MINRYLLILSFLFLANQMIFSQEGEICGSTMQAHQQMMEENDEYKQRVLEWRKKIERFKEQNPEYKNPNCANGPLKIPVAVHFDGGIVPAGQEACAIDVALNQIAELNDEIRGLDSDAGLINNFTSCFGANILGDACLEFCLGQYFHPAGYGLVDGDYAVTFNHPNVSFSIPSGNFTPVNADWDAYVNIYVDDLAGGLLGVSNGIPGQFNGDGVLIDNCVFGTGDISCPGAQFTGSAGCFVNFAEGEVLAHELGHYFGLYHIWGDNSNCSGSQDMIPDTPDMTSSYSSYTACSGHNTCADLPQTCGTEDMYMNFMSYAGHACMYMFTSDQSDVMYDTAVLEGYTTSAEICEGPLPVADFTPNGAIEVCGLDCVDFLDASTGTPDTWLWDFVVTAGDIVTDITSSTDQNPTVCFTAGTSGTLRVTLTVTNNAGSDTEIKPLPVTILVQETYYEDVDGDGFGNDNVSLLACSLPPGYSLQKGDCDDMNANMFPGNPEICDGLDNDCNTQIDDGLTFLDYYADVDGDGFGDPNVTINDCELPLGYVIDNTDCDDNNADMYPGNPEICDGLDNDCNTQIDDGLTFLDYYADVDGDGFGDPNNFINACEQPSGFILDNTDCDDTDPSINPSVTEICEDGIDNNCDGQIDEGCVIPECDGDYLVINSITQDTFNAEINITSDALVNGGQDVLFTAGTDIELNHPFEVVLGTTFEAKIQPCLTSPINAPENQFLNALNIKDFEWNSIGDINGDALMDVRIYNQKNEYFVRQQLRKGEIQSVVKGALDQLNAGIYYIELKSGKTKLIEKMVLLK